MPTKSTRNLTTTSFRIEADLLEEFKAYALADDRSMNAQLRRLIAAHVKTRRAKAAV